MPDNDPDAGGLGGAGQSNPTGDGSKRPVNWEAKYKGQQKEYEKVRLEIERLRQELSDTEATYEKDLSTVRLESKSAEKRAKDAETAATNFELAKNQYEKELTGLKTKQATAQRLSTEFPALVELHTLGDLREPSDFTDDAKYVEYLNRLNKLASSSKTAVSAVGATPSTATRGIEGGAVRTAADIETEMWNIDTKTSEGASRFEAALRELDLAMSKK